jgi:2'-5' RNA ligase
VAARVPDEVREDLRRLQVRLKTRGVEARWVATDSIHVTLKFLGELDPGPFGEVLDALSAPLEARGLLQLEVRSLGAFPSVNRARVVWVGLSGDVAPLARLALEIDARVELLGMPRERRPFQPHLTLGRTKGPPGIPGLAKALETEGDYRGPSFEVGELILYESRLRPQGPLYLPRLSMPLT